MGHPCLIASHRNWHGQHKAPDFDEGGDEGRPEDFNRCPRTALAMDLTIEEIHRFRTDSELIQMNSSGIVGRNSSVPFDPTFNMFDQCFLRFIGPWGLGRHSCQKDLNL